MSQSLRRESPPLYEQIVHGRNAYVSEPILHEASRFARRMWRFQGRVSAMEMPGGGIVKGWERFDGHGHDEIVFCDFLEACAQHGVFMPSSYADLFHQGWRSPRLKHSMNAMFAPLFAGGWEQAKVTGPVRHQLFRYDLNRAYLWALSRGLPDPASYQATFWYAPERPGVYAVSLWEPNESAPYPFNLDRPVHMAGSWEIEQYGLKLRSIRFGVTWDPTLLDTTSMVERVLRLPASKFVSRSFWGRWASSASLECWTPTREWALQNPTLHLIWAHWIVSGVKFRLWAEGHGAVHYFVDSIIVDRKLPTGCGVGDWRLDATFPRGLDVHAPGIYGEPGGPLDRHSGLKLTNLRRER